VEVADILRAQGDTFIERHPWLSVQQRSVLRAIVRCRTAALGGHVDRCDACGHQAISYNSCRNRHCPKCQAQARERWLNARERELLDVPYVHVVFTLPHALLPLAYRNSTLLYRWLFHASAATLREVAADSRHLGAAIGVLSTSYKDYAQGNARRTMTLTAMEFLRRFVQHILPRGFVRIRQSGFLANTCRIACVTLARTLLTTPSTSAAETAAVTPQVPTRATWACPRCGTAIIVGPILSALQLVTAAVGFDTS
jgi:predicted RNA-binding Zn-ribbon protein involved in translation (DUF1610 family)